MLEYIIYKLTREDGMLYVGTTDTRNFKNRMSQHKSTPRFRGTSFTVEILKQSPDATILAEESLFISSLNTLAPHGLNLTQSGKGFGHASPRFSTRGYRFSDASRQKMSDSAKRRCARFVRTGWQHSSETKKRWSMKRQGIHARTLKGKTLNDVCSQ